MRIAVADYKSLNRWDVKPHLHYLRSVFEVNRLGKYIYEHSERLNLNNYPEEEFPILGVNNKDGVYLNYYEKGKNINQPYKKVKAGELFYNPYRVNVGSIGIVPTQYNGFYTSPAYVVFGTTGGLLQEYLYLVLSAKWFNPILRAATSGSVRQNLTFTLLSDLIIPIPPLSIQKKLIGLWKTANKASRQLKDNIENKKHLIEDPLFSELGIVKKEYQKSKGPFSIEFRQIDRWSVDFNDYVRQGFLEFKSRYQVTKLSEVVLNYQYGSSDKANEFEGTPIIRMSNIIDGEIDISDLKYIKLDRAKHESLKLNKDDLLFNRTNSKELVGKTAVFSLEGDYVFASYLIRVNLNKKAISPYYANLLFNSSIIRNQIDAVSRRIIGQANVNTQELGNFRLPLPSLEKQTEIVSKVEHIKAEIASIKEGSNKLLDDIRDEIREIIVGKTDIKDVTHG